MNINGTEYVRKDGIPEAACFTDDQPPYGGVMLVETVTKFFVGEVVSVHPQEIVLCNACWVANTGRYHEFLSTGDGGDYMELEPCQDGPVIIGRGSIVDAQPYAHGLIRVAK